MAKKPIPKPKPKSQAKPVKISWYNQSLNYPQFKYPALIICLLLFIILPIMSLKVGIPSDEPIDAGYGSAALKFYASAGKDTSFSNLILLGVTKFPYQKYYGAEFEASTVGIAKLLGTPRFSTRHVITAIAGATLILFTTLFTAELYGWLAALIAVLLLASSPTLIGNSLFNTKDVPFAMGFAIALFFFVRWMKRLPDFSIAAMIGCIAGISISIGVRIGGLLLIAYFLFYVFLYLAENKDVRSKIFSSPEKRRSFLIHVLIISVAGFLTGNLFYPNFFLHGLSHVSETLSIAKKFPVKISMLYKGELINSAKLPDDYIPTYMLITFPLQVLAGFLIFFIVQPWIRKSISTWSVIVLLFSALFPVLYVIITKANVYNGWRHIMFAYPFFVSSAAVGYTFLYSQIKKRALQIAFLMIPVIMILNTGVWIFSNNPYQYIYYNELVGGVKGAYTYYDMDYQQVAAFNSYKWLLKSPEFKNNKDTPKKLVCNNTGMLFYDKLKADSVKLLTGRGYRDYIYQPWDFAILSSIFNRPEIIRYSYPGKGTIHEETVAGVPISCVVANENDSFWKGYQLYIDKKDSAFIYLKEAAENDPRNFRIWKSLANCYAIKGDLPNALKYFESYYELFPEDDEVAHVINNIRKTIGDTQVK